MTFEYRDADGGHLSVSPLPGVPYVLVRTDPEGCAVPADLVPDAIAGIRDAARTAATRQTTGQDDTEPHTCPDGEPCPGHDTPAVGQPAEAHDTDEAEILARAASDLCAFGHGEAAAFLRDRIKAITEPGTWVPQYGRPLSPDEQDTETQAAAETVEDER